MRCLLNEIIDDLVKESKEMEFHEILYEARERLHMRRSGAAEKAGIDHGKLEALESGRFRNRPKDFIVKNLCHVYGLPISMMERKLAEFLKKYKRRKKVNV